MRKRIGIYCANDEVLQLVPPLLANPDLEIATIFDPAASNLRQRLPEFDRELASLLDAKLTDRVEDLLDDALHTVIDASDELDFAKQHPASVERGVQVVSPLTARLLWCFGPGSGHRKTELLGALHEIVESYNLTIDADDLFSRMLEIAVSVTGAEGGSLMLLDTENRELRVRFAAGIEPELWTKIRVPLGEGIAGRVAADARPLRLRGKADREAFSIVRERLDVESAISVPMIFEGRVLGVLNLHHSTRRDTFSDEDLEFAEQLARLDAQIIAQSQSHEALCSQAARYEAVRRVRGELAGSAPLPDRLRGLCQFVAEHAGDGIATLYLCDPDDDDLRLGATSLEGGGFGGEYRVAVGQGIDGTVARTREAMILKSSDGALAYGALPLLAGETLAGVLTVQGGDRAPRGRAMEETLLEIAAAAAEEIVRAKRAAIMSSRATQLSAINETGIKMISTEDFAEVLRLGTSSAAMALEADHAILRLQDEQTGRYVIRSYFGSADGRLQERLFRLDKQVSVAAIKRRSPHLIRDVALHPDTRQFDSELRSVIAAPLMREARVVGTLAIYDKVESDRFYVGRFSDDDLKIFAKFVSYLERALTNSMFHAQTRRFRNFDAETGLPNSVYLEKRIIEEIARAGGVESALAIAVCRLENLDEIERSAGTTRVRQVVAASVEALRSHLRDFDVLGRTSNDEFTILLPDPGISAGDRVFALARAIADDLSGNAALNAGVRIALGFGYAVYPGDGADREALLEKAREPRIRMV
ncbi:MAG: GAF domain-containing protein [Myxococcota bacterium]